MTTFLLIRHGDTDAVGRYFPGRAAGLHLNERGRAEVAKLVDTLRAVPLTHIVSSPLERARETADPVARAHGLNVIESRELIEYDPGEWTGTHVDALSGDDLWRRFNAARHLTAAPGGELMLDVQRRAVTALLDLHRRFAGGTIAVVSHGDVIRAALLYLLGMPIDHVHRLEISPARVTVLQLFDDAVRVLQVNGDSAGPAS